MPIPARFSRESPPSRPGPPFPILAAALLAAGPCLAEVPENFRRENLVAWGIVPFDAKQRGPAERADMLDRLGLRRVAYDWREEHRAQFEDEMLAYQEHGIELFAFWRADEAAYALFEKHGLAPQVWHPLKTGKGLSNDEKIADAAKALLPLAEETARRGLSLGLYNQGGWGGLPSNLAGVCKILRAQGHDHVGIVYNFHHAHPRATTFAEDFVLMKPYLLCVTLNGMADPRSEDVTKRENRIKPIGSGAHEHEMIQELVAQGYEGAVGILGIVATRDVEEVLRENLEGLERILAGLP